MKNTAIAQEMAFSRVIPFARPDADHTYSRSRDLLCCLAATHTNLMAGKEVNEHSFL